MTRIRVTPKPGGTAIPCLAVGVLVSVATCLGLVFKRMAQIPGGVDYDLPPVCSDLNGDGRTDVTINIPGPGPSEWHIWQGLGHNRYALALAETSHVGLGILPGYFGPYDAGDADQDGLIEILGRNYEFVDSVGTYWNLVVLMESPAPESLPTRLAWYDRLCGNASEDGVFYFAGDLDKDGRREVLAVSHHGILREGTLIYENWGNDRYKLVWQSTDCVGHTHAIGDFDLDNRMEVVSCDYVHVNTIECLGDDQYWVPPWRDQTPYTNGIDVFSGQDVDQDGKPEFFVNYAVYRGMGWMHFLYGWEATGDNQYRQFFVDSAPGGGGEWQSQCGDIDGDGVEEILFSVDTRVHAYKAVGPDRFERVYTWGAMYRARARVQDLNQNGYNEVVLGGGDGVHIYEIEAIRLLVPNGGERLRPGDTCRVTWHTFDPPRCDSVSLFLRRDTTWQLDTIVTGLAPADTPYTWVVPETRADSCWLVAIAYNLDAWQWDETDAPLQILSSGIGEEGRIPVRSLSLEAWPNPAARSTTVRYGVTRGGKVEVKVFDRAGRLAATLVSGLCEPGRYELRWDCCDDAGRSLPAGIYFLQLAAGQSPAPGAPQSGTVPDRRMVKLILAED